MTNIARLLRAHLANGGTVHRVAHECDATPAAVYQWMRGTSPSARYIPALSRALGLSYEELLDVDRE